jgi:hypothetical protein
MMSHNVQPRHLSNFRHRTLYDFLKFYGKFPTHMFIACFRVLGRWQVYNEEQTVRNLPYSQSFLFPPKYGALQYCMLHLLVNTDNPVTFKTVMTVNMRIAFFCYVKASSLVEGVRVSEENVTSVFSLEEKISYPNHFVSSG